VLLTRRWDADAGATLVTYFVGACILSFPNDFLRWQAERRRWQDGLAQEMINCPEDRGLANYPGMDPADLVVGTQTVMRELRGMPTGTQEAAALVLDDLSFAEAAELLGTTERAIEGRLYRYRQSTAGIRHA
jgi:DNA-directed RNA polymerase specialized sigma24 family protein